MSKVLVIDDVESMRTVISTLLEWCGYEALEAPDGEIGFKLLLSEPGIALVITDVNMPVCNGYEFINKVRDNNLKIPIVVLTSQPADEATLKEAQDIGANGWIHKPINRDNFSEMVKKFLVGSH